MGSLTYWREPETSKVIHILPDKITLPHELPMYLGRERLLVTLRESLHTCASTIIHGRAGTGKTMLAAELARTSGRRVAWYEVDAPDGELGTFFRYLCASVGAGQRTGFGAQTIQRLGDMIGMEAVPVLVEYFVYELLECDEPLLIVIDDLHLVYDAKWVIPFFRRLLPLLPPEVHLVLMGRSLPPAPLWRMRSKQTLSVIDELELAFTCQEAEELFALYGLLPAQAHAAWKQTRGRAALLDENARRQAVMVEAAKVELAEESHRGKQLRLVKGYAPKTSWRTV